MAEPEPIKIRVVQGLLRIKGGWRVSQIEVTLPAGSQVKWLDDEILSDKPTTPDELASGLERLRAAGATPR